MITSLIDWLIELRSSLFEAFVIPAFYALGLMEWTEDAFEWMNFALFGALQVLVIVLVCRPLEAWRPVEPVADRHAVRTDMVFTLVRNLGLLPLAMFVLFQPLSVAWEAGLARLGMVAPTLDSLLPALADAPFLTFVIYVVLLDLADYWRHRLQHSLGWWWALHSLHHAQEQMTFWTDARNHVLDDILRAAWFAGVAMLIGIPPGQFPLAALVLRLFEALSHANLRTDFGALGRVVVSPHFHRIHHARDHAEAPHDRTHGCNFAVLLPVWDMIFGTARFGGSYPATGDLSGTEQLARGGWFGSQIASARRLVRVLTGRG
ncbi:MAG: sterol desaturase family protein [Acetobacteraceae bacterium]|nr:sterol desaturase family protein [Acetobacteraceae bacterium]